MHAAVVGAGRPGAGRPTWLQVGGSSILHMAFTLQHTEAGRVPVAQMAAHEAS